ncbi:MAG: endonuclease NucS [Candidatus Diapherotrites archaeon]|nr:endonuclease NucS [Candidatus Diapherotrites archaeon]
MEFMQAQKQIMQAIERKEMLCVIGECAVEYWGRAASKLPKGKRMLLIKGDSSFAIHQNKLLRPVNYMMGAAISSEIRDGVLVVCAEKRKPAEKITVSFYDVGFAQAFEMEDSQDLRLFGSEAELSKELMEDLSFIEPGLKPANQECPFRKGMVDIVAEDAQGNLVVIEVKRRKADYKAVSQLYRYMKEVEKMKGRKSRGILLAPDIQKKAREMLEEYGLEFARLDFEIGNPKAKIKGVKRKQATLAGFAGGQ